MAISLDNVGSGFKRSSINDNFTTIQNEINNNLLDKAGGKALTAALDLNSNSIINAGSVSTASLTLNGNIVTPSDLATSTLPDQTGNTDKLLVTDGAGAFWETKEIKFFNSVASLKAESLDAGRMVATEQYYASPANTGLGAGVYKILDPLDFSGTPDGYIDHLLPNGNIAQLQTNGILNVAQCGAAGDGVTDDTESLQAALNSVKTGGTLVLPSGSYLVTAPIIPQYSGESPLTRAALAEAGSATAGFIGDITIWGHGAKIVTTDATFTKSPYSAAMAFVATERVRVYGLIFESDHYNQTTGWMDSTNYLNLTEPTPKGSWGLLFVNFLDVKVVDCEFKHCNVGLVLTDDRVSSPTTTDAMRSYRSQVTGCRIFNCWTGLSMTYGATEEFIINNNHFEYTFIKLVQETDQGRALHFKDNTCRDISGIVFNANDSYISGNTFNNLLGGISLQPQGGGNPDATYDYSLVNLYITDNIVYSDHNTTLVSGTAQPEAFITINASATLTASQTVVIKGLHISNNNLDLWPTGSSSTGAFVGRAGNADISFSDVFIKDNVVKLNNASAVFVALAPSGVSTNTFYSGNIEVISNSFTRTANSGNIEFQFHANTYAEDIVVEFSNNYVDTQGNNRQVSVRNAGMLVSRDNKFIMTNLASSTTSPYYTMNVPLINITDNDIKIGGAVSEGYILYFDGETASTYSTDLDQAVVRVNNNRATNLQFAFNSPLTFPASAEGLYEITGNVSAGGFGTDPHPAITGFTTYNVTNPRITTTPPPAVSIVPSWYIVWSGDDTTGQPTGWKYNGAAWISLGTNP